MIRYYRNVARNQTKPAGSTGKYALPRLIEGDLIAEFLILEEVPNIFGIRRKVYLAMTG
jgi:hypothetical protein